MIPILYDAKEYDFDNNGIGRLVDCVSCIVTEEKNGLYECEFVYPMSGQFYSEISLDRIIKAKANDMSDYQLFRIYRITKPIDGLVKIYCQHISYDLDGVVVNPGLASSQYQGEEVPFEVQNATAQFVINRLVEMSVYPTGFSNRFTISATSSTVHDFSLATPMTLRACLGGDEESILSVYGGEFEFDNFNVYLKEARGQDTGVTILYGKNLTDINAETSITNTYTALFPYAIDDEEDELYTLSTNNGLVVTEQLSNFGEPRVLPVNLTSGFDLEEEDISEERLAELASEYITENKISDIYQNIEISFAQLWQTSEYKNIAVLERVGLCDVVTVKYSALGVSVKAKVIKTVYDCLKEKYDSIELGEAKASIGESIIKQKKKLEKVIEESATKSDLQVAIENATARITGQEGGYIVFNDHTSGTFYDGTPYNITSEDSGGHISEMLIMDTPDINTARKIWRYNLAGWGYSSNGYMGPFALAATNDGAIVADRITAGTLSGNLIRAGVIEDNTANGAKNYWNLSTGEFKLTANTKILKDNGTDSGIFYKSNGELRINADFIKSGSIDASLITAGILQDAQGTNYWNMQTGEFRLTGNTKVGTSSSNTTLSNYVSSASSNAVNQQSVFNALTDNGQHQGIFYTSNNTLYINADYIGAGTLNASLIKSGTLSSANGQTSLNMTSGDLTIALSDGDSMQMTASGLQYIYNNSRCMFLNSYELHFDDRGNGGATLGGPSPFAGLDFVKSGSVLYVRPDSYYSKLVTSPIQTTSIQTTSMRASGDIEAKGIMIPYSVDNNTFIDVTSMSYQGKYLSPMRMSLNGVDYYVLGYIDAGSSVQPVSLNLSTTVYGIGRALFTSITINIRGEVFNVAAYDLTTTGPEGGIDIEEADYSYMGHPFDFYDIVVYPSGPSPYESYPCRMLLMSEDARTAGTDFNELTDNNLHKYSPMILDIDGRYRWVFGYR